MCYKVATARVDANTHTLEYAHSGSTVGGETRCCLGGIPCLTWSPTALVQAVGRQYAVRTDSLLARAMWTMPGGGRPARALVSRDMSRYLTPTVMISAMAIKSFSRSLLRRSPSLDGELRCDIAPLFVSSRSYPPLYCLASGEVCVFAGTAGDPGGHQFVRELWQSKDLNSIALTTGYVHTYIQGL